MSFVQKLVRGTYSLAFWIFVATLVVGGFTQWLGLTRWLLAVVVAAYCMALYFLIRRHYGRGGPWGFVLGFGAGALLILRLVFLAPLGFALRDFVRESGGAPTAAQVDAFAAKIHARSLVGAEHLESLFRAEMWTIHAVALALLGLVGAGQAGWIPGAGIRRWRDRHQD